MGVDFVARQDYRESSKVVAQGRPERKKGNRGLTLKVAHWRIEKGG